MERIKAQEPVFYYLGGWHRWQIGWATRPGWGKCNLPMETNRTDTKKKKNKGPTQRSNTAQHKETRFVRTKQGEKKRLHTCGLLSGCQPFHKIKKNAKEVAILKYLVCLHRLYRIYWQAETILQADGPDLHFWFYALSTEP